MSTQSINHTLKSKTLKEIDIEQIHEINPFSKFVNGQRVVEIPQLQLESGITINNFPIAYKTWGNLNETGDNVLVICHALTGSSDVADWWGPLLGDDLAFDPSRFFIICLNSMGSPYGSFSPLSIDETTGQRYGPEFPLCTVRDDVRAHRIVLDSLGVTSIACVIGGSMGGMLALEWCAIYGRDYVKNLVALATSARHSAWCISWSEAQRQSIYSDPNYCDGYYSLDNPPSVGLSAARMSALLTYRSRDSFENKFSRRIPSASQQQKTASLKDEPYPLHREPSTVNEQSLQIHNDGISSLNSARLTAHCQEQNRDSPITRRNNSTSSSNSSITSITSISSAVVGEVKETKPAQTYFSAQSYLRYQGTKFVNRFDANCYIAITRKLDTHDLTRDREEYDENIEQVLNSMDQPSLIIGISSDGLFTYSEQEFLAEHLKNAHLEKITSPEGHDAFLLEFKLINELIVKFLRKNCSQFTSSKPREWVGNPGKDENTTSVFGEAEEVTNW
ncbi:homoserine O-acetyltransferase PWA37_002875 [Arxiozyma heterogenica]|uniref:homoserine O-acetyltransferase n=1 Tax=Arxiozyma heterogenica TaxID=278026 RepID=UPI002EF8BE17